VELTATIEGDYLITEGSDPMRLSLPHSCVLNYLFGQGKTIFGLTS
jgi:hypothetical protein